MSRAPQTSRIAARHFAMTLAAARVVDARLARMAASTPSTLARDYAEVSRMVAEKVFAAAEAAQAMGFAIVQSQMRAATASLETVLRGRPSLANPMHGHAALVPRSWQAALARFWIALPLISAAGLAPIARRVHANDRRLATRRRMARKRG